jgi:hypothetical protein
MEASEVASRLRKHSMLRRSLAPLLLGLATSLLMPVQALARAVVRFVHAVPGVGRATVKVDGQTVGSVAFAQATSWHSVRSGSFRWALQSGPKTLVSGTSRIGNGAYDIVVLDRAKGVSLGIYRAQAGKAGSSLIRVIHAAPELGSPELTLDSKPAVHSLSFTRATPYLSVAPGVHALGAMRPGDTAPLVKAQVKLSPGVAYSAVVVGSRGQQVRAVSLVDRGAPLVRHSSAHPAHSASRPAHSGASSSGPSHVVVVKAGDSLWSIARHLLSAGASNDQVHKKLVDIWDRNEGRIGTGDPNLIFPGTHLVVS